MRITRCELCFRESVDDIFEDVYSEHFYVERALLPIFRVYKLKGISKKLAVMLSTVEDVNSDSWNRLFDLCQEVRANSQLTALEIRIVLWTAALETRDVFAQFIKCTRQLLHFFSYSPFSEYFNSLLIYRLCVITTCLNNT